jgi:hypothetical protein
MSGRRLSWLFDLILVNRADGSPPNCSAASLANRCTMLYRKQF